MEGQLCEKYLVVGQKTMKEGDITKFVGEQHLPGVVHLVVTTADEIRGDVDRHEFL